MGGWSNPKPPFFGERKGGHPTPPPTPQNAQPNQFIPINKLACYGNNLSRNPLQGQLGGVLGCKKHGETTENKQSKQKWGARGGGVETKRQTNH